MYILSVQSSGMIFINVDGTIEGTDKIQRDGNLYTFTADIKESYGIIVEKKDIIIDGKCHTIEGTPRILPIGSWDYGIELSNGTGGNVTIKNLKIVNFNIGIYIGTANNTVTGNMITGGNVGITMAESPNTIVGNILGDNIEGVFLGPILYNHTKVYNVFYLNSFLNNTRHIYDCECTSTLWMQHLNIWDNGTSGNYWSDYDGIDEDKDGIGDTAYSVTDDDVDMYPLMEPLTLSLTENNGFLGMDLSLEIGFAITAGIVVVMLTIAYVILKRRNNQTLKKIN
ncbi:NosD domain-containing protein [Thermoproteota archaeon]